MAARTLVSFLIRTDIDEGIRRPVRRGARRNGIRNRRARLPDGVRIRCRSRRRAAQLRGKREVDRRKRTRHVVGSDFRDFIELKEGRVGCKVLCLPCMRRGSGTVFVYVQGLTLLDPKPLRILLGFQRAEPACSIQLLDLCPVVGRTRQEVRDGRLIDGAL